jgi:hypothetical protein
MLAGMFLAQASVQSERHNTQYVLEMDGWVVLYYQHYEILRLCIVCVSSVHPHQGTQLLHFTASTIHYTPTTHLHFKLPACATNIPVCTLRPHKQPQWHTIHSVLSLALSPIPV